MLSVSIGIEWFVNEASRLNSAVAFSEARCGLSAPSVRYDRYSVFSIHRIARDFTCVMCITPAIEFPFLDIPLSYI